MKPITTNRSEKLVFYLSTMVFLFSFNLSSAQPDLPKRLNIIRAIQSIHFGSFCIIGGGSGTVTVNPDGSRLASGNILLLNIPPFAQPALFEIKLKIPTVCFSYEQPNILLSGSSGSINLNLGLTNQGPNGSCFVLNPNPNILTQLKVGGTLTVTGSQTSGLYSGNFAILFTQK